jgi:hypothetical protein
MIKIMNLRHMFGPALVPLAFVFSGFFCSPAAAQLPSQNRFSPINYFGRWQGFGYSDGYHACKEGRCPPKWSFSSFCGEPTSPPATHLFHAHREANIGYTPQMHPHQASQQLAPVPSSPPRNFYETVSPAPLRKPESPSDKDYFELPLPPKSSDDLLPATPSVHSRRVPPGNQSLLHHSNYRNR